MFILLRPVGLTCQCKCGYCYYKVGHPQLSGYSERKIMDISLVEHVLEGLLKLPENFHTICLHGGEPLLIGKRWFEQFVNKVSKFNENDQGISCSIAIQTNGIDIDEDWIKLFRLGSVGVSVSIDGPQNVHDSARIDKRGNGTFERVVFNIQRLKKEGIEPCAISVITKLTTSLTPDEYYKFFKNLGFKEIEIAPYIEVGDSETEQSAKVRYEASSVELLTFVKGLFDLWLYNSDSKKFVNIRLFEQTIAAILGYIPTLCNLQGGLACGRTPCVMPDGTIFACDLETNEIDLKLGTLMSEKFENIVNPERLQHLHNYIRSGFIKRGCDVCELLGLCGFACPRHVFSETDFLPYCIFVREFIEHVKHRLNSISKIIYGDIIKFPIQEKGTAANTVQTSNTQT